MSPFNLWSTLVVSAHENYYSTDFDADYIYPTGKPATVFPEERKSDWGYSGLGYGSLTEDNISAIFREPIHDMVRQMGNSATTDEAHTIAHEIGHTAGAWGLNGHDYQGIMYEGAPRRLNGVPNDHFDNESQAWFRSVTTW